MLKIAKFLVFFIFLLTTSLFTTCEDPSNPFSNNLGKKVVVEPPTVNVDSPISGSYLTGSVTFTGKAKAYLEARKVEMYIYANEDNGQKEIPWTDDGIVLKGSIKEKTWTYKFDTSKYNSGKDGSIKMKFRVHDNKSISESVDLVYIIKNFPSDIKMTSPDSTRILDAYSVSKINIGGEIQGQVIDRRGLRPGYPQIKLWPADQFTDNEPADNDPRWGWASLFLPGIGSDDFGYDSLQKEGDGNPAGPGTYADRSSMPVVRAAQFSLHLADYDIEVDPNNSELRRIKYRVSNDGRHIPFESGKVFKFRIRTKDTSSDPINRMLPTDDPPQIEGFFPPLYFGEKNENNFRPRGEPVMILIVSADTRPTIEINNDDIAQTVLGSKPNVYITETTSKKIALGKTGKTDFRLQVLAIHPDGIDKATLQYQHESSGRAGFLKWDDVTGGLGYVDGATDETKAKGGYKGKSYNNGKLFTFTAKDDLKGVEASNDLNRSIFTTSSEPYTLTVTVSPPGGPETSTRYVLYMDGTSPNVSIRSVKGAYKDPAGGAGDLSAPVAGFTKNENPYIVNGNIQVLVAPTDDSGIMAYRSVAESGKAPPDTNGYPMVKWIVELATETETEPAATGTILQKLKAFKDNPSAANLQFFNDITDERPPTSSSLLPSGLASGWVKRPIANATNDADKAQHFKFNTANWDKKYLWVYVIAQDGVQNLGFIVQKIYVDNDTDKPEFEISTLDTTNAGGTAITGQANLNVTVGADRGMSGNWSSTSPRKNILEKDQGIDLNFLDDDGINLDTGGVRIVLTDLNTPPAPNSPVTLTAAQVKEALKAGNKRDWSGTLSQTTMAAALYGQASKGSLKDGMYQIQFTVTDDINEKVAITPAVIPGDTPTAESKTVSYFFAVSTELPEIVIENPEENSLVSSAAIEIKGYVKSRLKVQRSWITFNPDVVEGKPTIRVPEPLALYPSAARTIGTEITNPGLPSENPAVTPDADGYYTYYWQRRPEIGFNPAFTPQFDYNWRRITVEAYDRLGNLGALMRTTQIDNKPPDITLIDFNYSRPGEVYGKVPFTASASDASGLYETGGYSGIKWFVFPTATAGPSWSTGYPSYGVWTGGGNFLLTQAEQGGRYTGIIDTRKLADKTEYRLWIVARDAAGNEASKAVATFMVDQDKDYPVVDTNNLDPMDNSVKGKANLYISGTVTDADLFDKTKQNTYVQIHFPADSSWNSSTPPTSWGAWINVPGTINASSGALDFKILISSLSGADQTYFSTDGRKYYQLQVSDEPDKGTDNYGKNPDGNTSGNPNYDPKKTKTYPATGAYQFMVDDVKPVIFFNNNDPVVGHPDYTSFRPTFSTWQQLSAALAGTVVETNLSTLSFTYGSKSKIITTSGANNAWNMATDSDAAALFSAFSTSAEGPQNIVMEAIDVAGLADRVSWNFSKDTKGPEIVFKNIAKAIIPSSPANTVAPSVVPGSPPVIQGTFSDEISNILQFNSAGDYLTTSFQYRFDGGTWKTKPIIRVGDKKNTADWEITLNSTDGFTDNDGLYKLDIKISDSAGNETLISNVSFLVDRANPTLNASADFVVNDSININGPLAPASRVFSAEGAATNAVAFTLSGKVSDFNLTNLQITIGQDGSGSNPYIVAASWERDIVAADGSWAVTTPVDQLTSGGTTGADGTLKRLSVTGPVNNSSGVPEWTWTLQVLQKDIAGLRDAAPAGTKDSARRYINVTAYDKAKKRPEPASQVWEFYLDTRKPDIEYTTLEKGADGVTFENNTFTLSGNVSDDTGIKEVRYLIGKWDYSANDWRWYKGTGWTENATSATVTTPGSWPIATGTMNWSINQAALTAAGVTEEGKYRLDLYVTDWSLGNGNPHNTRTNTDPTFSDAGYSITAGTGNASGRIFYIDKTDPKLVWAAGINDKTYFKNENGQVNFGFTAGDNNTIQKWEAVIKDESGTVVLRKGNMGNTTAGNIPDPGIITTVTADQNLTLSPFMTVGGTANGTPLDVAAGDLPKTYTLTITVVDGAKKSSSISKQFILDNRPPVLENFRPTSFANGTVSTYEAVTGKLNVRGNTSDNSNQLRRVAFYIPPAGPNFNASYNFPNPNTPNAINDATIATDGWHWHDASYPNSYKIDVGGTTVINIEQGTFAWEIRVPQTSLFLNDEDVKAKKFVQWTTTSGMSIGGTNVPTPGNYRDVNTSTWATTTTPVPALTFQDLMKSDPNDKTIYGGENVGLITVYMLAEDMAGNVKYDVLKYWLWPEGDRPQVISINNPDSNKIQAERLLNGSIRLSGLARDNEQVKYVWFRVLDKNGVPYTNLHIPVWNEDDWTARATEQSPVDGTTIGSRRSGDDLGTSTGGWYKANGGSSRSVSWWAYVNTQGELDPAGLDANEITVEVRVQDVTFDDSTNDWKAYTTSYRGFASTPKSVKAWVVAGAPIFDNVWVANGASDVATTNNTWGSIDTTSIRNRSSYRVTVKHNSGISAIRWSPTTWNLALNNNTGGFQSDPNVEAYNLLTLDDGKYVYQNSAGAYVTADKTAAFAALEGTNPATRMAVTVKPRGMFGPNTVSGLDTNKNYLILKWDIALEDNGFFDHDASHYEPGTTIHKDMKNTIFKPKKAAGNLGAAVIIESDPEGAIDYFKWDVFVDVRADILMSDIIAKDPAYGNGTPARAGQTKNSVRYPVYLSATEVSRATPLTTRGDTLLPIDNLPPTAMYTLNRRPAGLAATIGGEAGDDGPVNGVAKVVLWFSRMNAAGTARTFISWHEQYEAGATTLLAANFQNVPLTATSGAGWWDDSGVIAAWNAANPGKPQVQKPYIPAIDVAGAADGVGASAIVIDRNSPSVGQEAWGHKLPMGFADGGMGKYWYVEINTFGILSGPVTMHYVVIDKAGNATYYYEPLVIMNNAPMINKIKLATDIRDNNDFRTNWTANTRVGKGTTATPSGTEANGRNQILQYIWNRVPLGTTDVQKGITDDIYSSAMVVDKIIDFNVRNKLFAMRIETTNGPGSGKTRNFRLEYVSNAKLLTNTSTTDKTLANNMKAGRVYIINDPGSARWGAIGAEGDGPWPRGYAFLAAVDGTNEEGAARIDGTGSAWELNSSYYNAAGARILPTALNLGDVAYTANNSGINTDATSAEFVYYSGAFGATAGSTIVDYNNPSDAYPPNAGVDPVAGAGNSLFILRVFDGLESDQFGDFKIIRIRVNNDDKTKPFSQIYDLNPMTEGQERAQTLQRSLTPMFIGEGTNSNRTKGGLWNTDETARFISKPGHIEPRSMTTGYGSAATGNLYTATITGESAARNHSLSSAQMGGAATKAAATVQKPWADPAGYFATDTVSGQVVLRGYVEDDQRIEQVDLLIGSSTVTILSYYNNAAQNTTAGTAGYGTAGESATYTPPRTGFLQIPAAQIVNNIPKVYFTDTIDLYRHRVEWAYVWDTETIPAETVVSTNVNVRVRSNNRNSAANNANKPSDNTAAPGSVHTNTSVNNPGFPVGLNKYNSINVNLRPYITGFKRDASKFFHNNRSMQGWTAFARGEVVVVEGFNLGRTTPAATTSISIPGSLNVTTNNATAQQTSFELASAAVFRYRSFTIGANATPGTVTLTVANMPAVNTSTGELAAGTTRVIQPWNIEYSPGIDGSQLWDDTRSVHIWKSDSTATGSDRGAFIRSDNWYIMNPAMSIDPRDGTLWSSHNEGGRTETGNNGNTWVSANNSDTRKRVAGFIDPILYSDIYFSPGDGTTSTTTGASEWSAFSLFGRAGTSTAWRDLGGLYIYGPNGVNAYHNSEGTLTNASASQYIAESTYYNASTVAPGAVASPPSTDQFLNPHIITSRNNNQEHIHVSYYDSKDGSMKYRYNRRGTAGTIDATGASYGWTNLDGGVDADDQTALTAAAPFDAVAANGRIVNYSSSLDGTRTARGNIDAGRHNSIALNSNGYPYIAYFDETNQKLKLAVSNSTTPYAASAWKIINDVIPSGNLSHNGTGQFVSMRIDTKSGTNPTLNKIHIAALNSVNKQLVYVSGYVNYANGTFGGNTNGTGEPVVQVVDSVGMVGRWCSLSLDSSGNPWIAYQDESNLGSMDGVKMAFLDTTKFKKAASDLYGASVSGWETMHVPAQYRVENPLDSGREHGRLGMECWPTRNYTGTAARPNGVTDFWSGAVSYRSPDLYRIAYYVKP